MIRKGEDRLIFHSIKWLLLGKSKTKKNQRAHICCALFFWMSIKLLLFLVIKETKILYLAHFYLNQYLLLNLNTDSINATLETNIFILVIIWRVFCHREFVVVWFFLVWKISRSFFVVFLIFSVTFLHWENVIPQNWYSKRMNDSPHPFFHKMQKHFFYPWIYSP